MRCTRSLLGALALLLLPTLSRAQTAEFTAHERRLVGLTSYSNGFFGNSLALSGDTLAVGTPGATDLGPDSGTVFLWGRVNDDWQIQTQLHAPDGATGERYSVLSLQGDTLAVGAPFHMVQGTPAGAVYVYQRSAGVWLLQAELLAPGPVQTRYFGSSLSLDGTRLLVGSRGAAGLTGTAYVFVQSGGTWTFESQLDAADGQPLDEYGASVCLRGDSALVGAYGDDLTTADEGSVYVFERSGAQWNFRTKLTALDASQSDGFGISLDIEGDVLAVGAWMAGDSPANQPGAVYLFQRQSGAWIQSLKLQPSNLTAFARFGASVELSAGRLVVGAPGAGNYGGSGAAYFYQYLGGAWLLRQRLWPQGAVGSANFGARVALDGELLAVSAPLDGENPFNQGSLRAYRTTTEFDALCFGDGSGADCPCANTTTLGFGMGCRHSGAKGGRLLAEGHASVSADTLTLRGSEMHVGAGLYIQAQSALNLGTGLPLMDGLLCIGGSPIRLGAELISSLGDSAYPAGGSDLPVSVRGAVAPGTVCYYQVYYRDNATFCTSALANFSNAVRVSWQP
jgi:hypothetical protein